ncbi:hypothetical protein K470DRAFT_255557 [Piedraia hortae CBS 480.64]|uniref:Uncharacterized protein n=1 Tax=Piedraia hortae CBS 480.64 TaxID=1314780 RepID=A0A6A7C6I4_9PEZI|nr:hypothetical protein K470DRAFT_255557 [Piedraia hortae CBS 480.64]
MAAYDQLHHGSRLRLGGSGGGTKQVPTGACHARDAGGQCGCRTFYPNDEKGDAGRRWCYCGHHACFHEQAIVHQQLSQRDDGFKSMAATQVDQTMHSKGLGVDPSRLANTQFWNALNGFARQQEDISMEDAPAAYPAAFSRPPDGHGGQLQRSHIPTSITVQGIYQGADDLSTTEMATPSVKSPDMGQFPGAAYARISTPPTLASVRLESSKAAQGGPSADVQMPSSAAKPSPNPMSDPEVHVLLRTLACRVDSLESLSFNQAAVEEMQEKLENIDTRIFELEQWRTEREQEANRNRHTAQKHTLLYSTSSSSAGSFDSSAAVQTEAAVLATLAAQAELGPRISGLETRINDLEDLALPSLSRPWHVQVVLLPWGRDLKGIWFSSDEQPSSSQPQASPREWGSESQTRSTPILPFGDAWTTRSISAWASETQDWLCPKACGPHGLVFQRLASRGLVQDISLTAPNAHHILQTIHEAFGEILPDLSGKEESPSYQGLNEAFIPLRKVRKSSRLRFLSPSEMVTSATWSAQFLDAGIFMKLSSDSIRRLYITTPEAYIQPSGCGFSWRSLRRLPVHNATPEEENLQSVAIEACWSYCERLDRGSEMLQDPECAYFAPPTKPPPQPPPQMVQKRRTLSVPRKSRRSKSQSLNGTPPATGAPSKRSRISSPMSPEQGSSSRKRSNAGPAVGLTPRWSGEPSSPPIAFEYAEETEMHAGQAYLTPYSNLQNSLFPAKSEDQKNRGPSGAGSVDMDMHGDGNDEEEEEWNGIEKSSFEDSSDGE